LLPGNANLPAAAGALHDANQEIGVPRQSNNLFNRIYPLFEFVFATGLLQAG
jgi:hypothetical protein